MSARLRVAVDAELVTLSPSTGHGRVWERLLYHLSHHVEIVRLTRRGADRFVRGADVLLVDGHVCLPHGLDSGRPVVAVVHDVRWTDPSLRATLPVSFLGVIVPETEQVLTRATRVVAPSHFVASSIRDAYGIEPARVECVPYGVDSRVFAPRRRRQAVGHGSPYVVFVGSVEPRKNIEVLRTAMGGLARRGFPHRLVLRLSPAPATDSRDLLAAAKTELPGAPSRVVALPPLDDRGLAWVLSGADAFCLPSLCEGFGLPALEAMACGTPVVVAGRGALPEIVGDAGLVVEPTADAVEEALAALLTDLDLAASLATRGRARAEAYSWSRTAAAYSGLLAAAAEEDRPPHSVRVEPWPAWLPVRRVERCPVCGAGGGRPIPGVDRAGLSACERCGAIRSARSLDPVRFTENGAARRMPAEWPGVALDEELLNEHVERSAAARLALLRKVSAATGTLVDVRAGSGALVEAARAAGWDAVGYPDLAAATRARRDGPRVDAVVASHVVEHEIDAVDALRSIAAMTRPGGLVVVEVPNWRSATRRRDVRSWHHLRPLEHVVHFDRDVLESAVRRAGLVPLVTISNSCTADDLEAATHPLPPFRRILRFALRRASTSAMAADRAPRVVPTPKAAALLHAVRGVYDRLGLGDVLITIARVPAAEPNATARADDGGDHGPHGAYGSRGRT